MAEYGIVIKIDGIDGNCKVKGYEKALLVNSVSFGSSSSRSGPGKTRHVSVNQSPISMEIAAGSWVAELTQACFVNHNLKKAVITQMSMPDAKDGDPRIIQQVTIENPVVVSVEQDWDSGDGPRTAGLTLQFEKILFGVRGPDNKEKTADFTLRNFSKT